MSHLAILISSPMPSEATSAQTKSYVTYTLSSLSANLINIPTITLLEARNLVSAAGTTGLRTWEAALHLGNYLCANRSIIRSKSVLELGAGTGFVSVLCSKHLQASHVLATDGSDDVVAGLSTNFYLNALQDSVSIEGKELKWGYALVGGEDEKWESGRKIDVVLGADLTYDGSGIPALVSTFGDLCNLNPEVKIIIAATVRNPKTFKGFLNACRNGGFRIQEIEFGVTRKREQEGPFYEDSVPIQLSLITKTSGGGNYGKG
jgi:predicted nicotinamide N-methyase